MKRAEIEKQFKNAGISKIDTDIQNIKLKALKKEAKVLIREDDYGREMKGFTKEQTKKVLENYFLGMVRDNGIDFKNFSIGESDTLFDMDTSKENLEKKIGKIASFLYILQIARNVKDKYDRYNLGKYEIKLRTFSVYSSVETHGIFISISSDNKAYRGARDPIKFEAELKYVVLEKMGERLKELEEIVYLPKNFWKYTATI